MFRNFNFYYLQKKIYFHNKNVNIQDKVKAHEILVQRLIICLSKNTNTFLRHVCLMFTEKHYDLWRILKQLISIVLSYPFHFRSTNPKKYSKKQVLPICFYFILRYARNLIPKRNFSFYFRLMWEKGILLLIVLLQQILQITDLWR